MTLEENLEFLNLNQVLNDTFKCNRINSITLNQMIKRYAILIDKFIKQYEITPNSSKGSVTN